MPALDPLVPYTVLPPYQNGQFDQNTPAGESILPSLANPSAKALQAEINSSAVQKNRAYTFGGWPTVTLP